MLRVLSPMETILLARRTCPKCKRDFLIENGKTKRISAKRSWGRDGADMTSDGSKPR